MGSIPQPGKVCTKCHEWKLLDRYSPQKQCRDGLKSWCKDCNSALARKFYADNANRSKEYTRKWRAEHADYEREKMREYNAAYYQENAERIVDQVKEWRNSNPDKVKVIHQTRRARKRNASGSYTAVEWQALCNWFGSKCLKCGKAEITVDHVIPLVRGGSNSIDNLQPLCMSCNSSKQDRTADYRNAEQLAAFLAAL